MAKIMQDILNSIRTKTPITHGPHQSGIIYKNCQVIAGHVEMGEENIFLVISNWSDVKYLTPILRKVFKEHDLPFKPQAIASIIKSDKATLRFILNDRQLEQSIAGREGLVLDDLII